MANPHPHIPDDLLFYISAEHECSYFPERKATSLFADPDYTLSMETFSTLSEMGFRRSGCLTYTHRCKGCSACIPTRVNTQTFRANRSQRRNHRQNSDLSVHKRPCSFTDEHIALYQKYISSRHPDGSMNVKSKHQIEQFFTCHWTDSLLIEFRHNTRLLAVSVIDRLSSGYSAVYTFYDPEETQRGLGVYAVLCLIEEAKNHNLPYLYLGYLIHESPKMSYKSLYRPQEHYLEGRWLTDNDV